MQACFDLLSMTIFFSIIACVSRCCTPEVARYVPIEATNTTTV